MEIQTKEESGVHALWGYTIFWLKNLDDLTMVCFTDFYPNHYLEILEDDAVLAIFHLDKNKKT